MFGKIHRISRERISILRRYEHIRIYADEDIRGIGNQGKGNSHLYGSPHIFLFIHCLRLKVHSLGSSA